MPRSPRIDQPSPKHRLVEQPRIERDVSLAASIIMAVEQLAARNRRHPTVSQGWHELTPALTRLLWCIDPDEQEISMSRLARRAGCHASGATRLMGELEQRRLAIRTQGPMDGRLRSIGLTPLGSAVRRNSMQAAVDASPMGALTRRQRLTLAGLLLVLLEE